MFGAAKLPSTMLTQQPIQFSEQPNNQNEPVTGAIHNKHTLPIDHLNEFHIHEHADHLHDPFPHIYNFPQFYPLLPPSAKLHPKTREMMENRAREAYQSARDAYNTPYQPPQSSCGSNLLIGCHPHVQSVPCGYSAPHYHHPAEAHYQPPPPPPSPAYAPPSPPSYSAPAAPVSPAYVPSSPAYAPPSSAAYAPAAPAPPLANVYSQPGPPYPESNLQTVHSVEPLENVTENEKEKVAVNPHSDSQPEPSNQSQNKNTMKINEEEDNESEVNVSTTTQQPTVEELKRKIDDHVENMEKFREMAERKFKDVLMRRPADENSATDFQKFLTSCNEFQAMQTKHLMNSPKIRRNFDNLLR